MQVITMVSAMQQLSRQWRGEGERIGFVPTMGSLHAGHLSLVEEAARRVDRVVVSIFVNPLQFDREDDLDAYPRTLETDIKLLSSLPIDVVFAPSEAEMYPNGREAEPRLEVEGLEPLVYDLEGASRQGHFQGVVTVVKKFFDIVQPQVAVFGEKDYQQLLVVRYMAEKLELPVDIQAGETCREPDGLAMSSRNAYLTAEERERAGGLYAVLCWMRQAISDGRRDFAVLCSEAKTRLSQAGFKPDYVEIRRQSDLGPTGLDTAPRVILAAAWLGRARLIDNIKV